MTISQKFSGFYHKVILKDLFEKSNELIFRSLMDTRTGGAFKIVKYEDYNDEEDLKQLLKILNLDYPVDEDKDEKVSTRYISSKDLVEHVEYVFKIAAHNCIDLDVVREEWERLIKEHQSEQ